MAQIVKVVDLTKSYMPGDPNAFPDNLHFTQREDAPDQFLPILMYEGYNFLPTSYGYRSYFGTESALTLEALPKPCDEIITFQSDTYQNVLIAFCSDGIRTATAGATVWTLAVPLPDDYTNLGKYKQYTWCVIENNLYIYRQGHTHVIKIDSNLVITTHVPSFLNMAGQMGIFRGNGRLCFWDSENSVAWSSAFDLFDLTPSIENMVGNTIFLGVLGRIVNIIPHGEGYVVYATRSIVGVTYSTTGTVVWDASTITSAGGITHPKAACVGQGNEQHFAYTTIGVVTIGHFNALSKSYAMEIILPELFDYLKESRDPVYLQCHAARFLYFSLINDNYINGITSFTEITVPSLQAPVIIITKDYIDGIATSGEPPTGDQIVQIIDSFLRDPKGTLLPDYTAASYQVPRWTMYAAYKNPGLYAVQAQKLFPRDESQDGIFYRKDIGSVEYGVGSASVNHVMGTEWFPRTYDVLLGIYAPIDYIYNNIRIHTHLYANTDIPINAANTLNYNCWDSIYNILSIAKQESDILSRYLQNVQQSLGPFTYQYTTVSLNIPDLDNTDSDPIIFFKKSPTLTLELDTTTAYPQLRLGYFDARAITIVPTTSRTLVSSHYVETPAIDLNLDELPIDGMYFVAITWSGGTVNSRISWKKNFASEPTVQQIVTAVSADPVYIAGMPCILDISNLKFFPMIYRNQSFLAISLLGVTLRSNTYPDLVLLAQLSVVYVESFDDDIYSVSYNSVESEMESLVAIGNPTLDTTNSPYFYCVYDTYLTDNWFGSKSLILEYVKAKAAFSYEFFTWSHVYCKVAHTISIDPESLVMHVNNDVVGGGIEIRGNGLDITTNIPFTNRIIHVFNNIVFDGLSYNVPDTGTGISFYITTVEETTSITLQESTSAAIDAEYSPSSITFTQEGTDTYTRQVDGSYNITASTNNFTVTKDKVGLALDFVVNPAIDIVGIPNDGVIPVGNPSCTQMTIVHKSSSGTSDMIIAVDITDHIAGKIHQVPSSLGIIPGLNQLPACYNLGQNALGISNPLDFTYPGATFTLQNGIPVPAYPTLVGSLVFDTQLKKWGKQSDSFKCLLQFSPINATNNEAIPYTNFGMDSGILHDVDKKIKLFSVATNSSQCRWGKIALYRLGFTEMLEVTFNFRTNSTGKIIVDGSTDAREINTDTQHEESFTDVRQHVVKCHVAAMWHTISISGNFDLQYMEFRAIMASRR